MKPILQWKYNEGGPFLDEKELLFALIETTRKKKTQNK